MLTRHFYELDDVRANLAWSLLNRRIKDALFWCQELIDSQEEEIAFLTLLEFWCLHRNFMFPIWIRKALTIWKDSNWDNLTELCYNLCICKDEDCSVFSVLCLQSEPVDRIMKGDKSFFENAILQGRARTAWWYACTMLESCTVDTFWEFLSLKELKTTSLSEKIALCSAIVFDCGANIHSNNEWCSITDSLYEWLVELASVYGHKSRRILSISEECMYALCERGFIDKEQNNLDRIRGEKLFCDGFWYRNASLQGFSNGIWNSDEDYERFFETYFPEDIPDEWSLKEQMKSHGAGILRKNETEKITLSKFHRLWFSEKSRLTWGFENRVKKICEETFINRELGVFGTLFNRTLWNTTEDIHTFIQPVQRKIISV